MKEEIKDINKELSLQNDVFLDDKFLSYIYEKSKKLQLAIYIVSDIIKDIEPIKWKLRDSVNNLSTIRTVREAMSEPAKNIFLEILLGIKDNLLVCQRAKIISRMNSEVLIREAEKLMLEVAEKVTESAMSGSRTGSSLLSLAENFFDVEKPPSFQGDLKEGRSESKGQSNVLYNPKMSDRPERMMTSVFRGFKKDFFQTGLKDNDSDKVARRQQILDIIRQKNEVSIKDISLLIKNCSEKTIQRELNSLLDEGIIKKTGDRRWSRYHLSS